MEYLSKQRYDEIAAELDNLINVVYPTIREDVAETSAQGDRRMPDIVKLGESRQRPSVVSVFCRRFWRIPA